MAFAETEPRRAARLVFRERLEDLRLLLLAKAADLTEAPFLGGLSQIGDRLDPELLREDAKRVKPDAADLRQLEDAARQTFTERAQKLGAAGAMELFDLRGERDADARKREQALPILDQPLDRLLGLLERACPARERTRLVSVATMQLEQRRDLTKASDDRSAVEHVVFLPQTRCIRCAKIQTPARSSSGAISEVASGDRVGRDDVPGDRARGDDERAREVDLSWAAPTREIAVDRADGDLVG